MSISVSLKKIFVYFLFNFLLFYSIAITNQISLRENVDLLNHGHVCHVKLDILNCSPNKKTIPKYTRYRYAQFYPSVFIVNCDFKKSLEKVQMTWQLWKLETHEKKIKDIFYKTSFVIEEDSLDFGIYKLKLTVDLIYFRTSGTDIQKISADTECFFEIVDVGLQTIIYGGYVRSVYFKFDIYFKVTTMFAPSRYFLSDNEVVYWWKCLDRNQSYSDQPETFCDSVVTSRTNRLIKGPLARYVITANQSDDLRTIKTYEFSLFTGFKDKYSKQAVFQSKAELQLIRVTDRPGVNIGILCLLNCGGNVFGSDPKNVIHLEVKFEPPVRKVLTKEFTIIWLYQLEQDEKSKEIPLEARSNDTSTEDTELRIKGDFLRERNTYFIFVNLMLDGNITQSAMIKIFTCSIPSDLKCTNVLESNYKGIQFHTISCSSKNIAKDHTTYVYEFHNKNDSIDGGRHLGFSRSGLLEHVVLTRPKLYVRVTNLSGAYSEVMSDVVYFDKEGTTSGVLAREIDFVFESHGQFLHNYEYRINLLTAYWDILLKTPKVPIQLKFDEINDLIVKLESEDITSITEALTFSGVIADIVNIVKFSDEKQFLKSESVSILAKLLETVSTVVEKHTTNPVKSSRFITTYKLYNIAEEIIKCSSLILESKAHYDLLDQSIRQHFRLTNFHTVDTATHLLVALVSQQYYALNDFSMGSDTITIEVSRLKEVEELIHMSEEDSSLFKIVPSAKLHAGFISFAINPFWWSNGYQINTQVKLLYPPIRRNGTFIHLPFVKYISCELKIRDFKALLVSGKVKQPNTSATPDFNDKIIAVHRIESETNTLSIIKFTDIKNDSSLRVVFLIGLRPDYDYMASSISKLITINSSIINFEMKNAEESSFFYIGILPGTNSSEVVEYNFTIYNAACKSWNYNTWKISKHCSIGNKSNTKVLFCNCTLKKRISGGHVYIPNHHFSPFYEFPIFISEIDYPFAIFYVVIYFILYFISLLWAIKRDKKDFLEMKVNVLEDNVPYDSSVYLVGVFTGARVGAGTSANVGFMLLGDEGVSRAHVLSSPDRPILQCNSDDWFFLTTPKHLGSLTDIILWSDHTGQDPNWYCSKIQVFDLVKYENDFFFIESWFGITAKEVHVESFNESATFKETNKISRILSENMLYAFMESHYLFSVFFKHSRSRVTRTQRLSIVFFGVLLNTLVCVLFYHPYFNSQVEFSSYMTSKDILTIGLIGSSIESVVSFFIMYHFYSCYSFIDCPSNVCSSRDFHDVYHFKRKISADTREPELIKCLRSFIKRHVRSIKALPLQNESNMIVGIEIKRMKMNITLFLLKVFMIIFSILIIILGLNCGSSLAFTLFANILFSFILTNLVIRPLNIVVTAVIMSLIKIRYYELMTFSIGVKKIVNNLKQKCTKNYIRFLTKLRNLDIYRPLPEEKVKELQPVYQRYVILLAIYYTVGCASFFCVTLWLIQLFKIGLYFLMNMEVLCREFGTEEQCSSVYIYDVENIMDIWSNLPKNIFPAVYTSQWYNGMSMSLATEQFPRTGWLRNSDSRLIGVPRVRQIRVKSDNLCRVPKVMRNVSRECETLLSDDTEDKGDYGLKWDKKSGWQRELFQESPWVYTEPSPELGKYLKGASGTLYHSGGYVASLQHQLSMTKASILALTDSNWIDSRTRIVTVDFTVYNVNNRIFTVTYIVIEIMPEGNVKVMNYFLSTTLGSFMKRGVLFSLLFIAFVIELIFVMNVSGVKNFFQNYWNIYDSLIVVVFVYTTVLVVNLIQELARENDKLSKQGKDVYFSVEVVIYGSQKVKTMIGVLFSLMLFRLLRIIRFNEDVGLYAKDLLESRTEIIYGSFITIMFMFIQFRLVMYLVSTPRMYSLKDVLIFKSQFKKIVRDESNTATGKVLSYVLNFTSQLGIFSLMLSQYHHYKKAQRNTRVKSVRRKERAETILFGKSKKKAEKL